MTERQPTREETVIALRRMIATADERGSYMLDGLDARWLEAAIDFILGERAQDTKP